MNERGKRVFVIAACLAIGGLIVSRPTEAERSFSQELAEAIAATSGPGFASPAEDLRAEFESKYEKARVIRLGECDHCEGCLMSAAELKRVGGHLETHHKKSVLKIFNEGLDRSLIYDPRNLIVLCRNGKFNCHFRIGHDPDGPGPRAPNFKESNPNVERDARNFAKSLQK